MRFIIATAINDPPPPPFNHYLACFHNPEVYEVGKADQEKYRCGFRRESKGWRDGGEDHVDNKQKYYEVGGDIFPGCCGKS